MQTVERTYTQALSQAIIDHSCTTKIPRKARNINPDISAVNLLIKDYTVSKLLISEEGGIGCTLCDKQLKMSDRQIVKSKTAQCVKIIQHIYYGVDCTYNRMLGGESWKVYAQEKPILNQSGVEIHCYPKHHLGIGDPADQVITFLQSQHEIGTGELTMSASEYNRSLYLAGKRYFLFYRETTFQGTTSWDNVGYVCYKCGAMITPDMMQSLINTHNLRHIGAYLHLLSPACHPMEQNLANDDLAANLLLSYERMIDPNLSLLPIMGQSIEDLFEWNFHRYSFPSSFSETLKGELKKIFVDQFNSYSENERETILSNIGNGQFNDDMTALFYQTKTEGVIPDIYKTVYTQRPKFSCGFDCNNVPDIIFLPCGHILYCTTCWTKKLSTLKSNGCPVLMCHQPQITEYMVVGHQKNYDLNGSEIRDKSLQIKRCCLCRNTLSLQSAIYSHFKYNSDFGQLCTNDDDLGATFDSLSIGEEHKLSEAAGGAEQSETIDTQEEEELIHSICPDCASTTLKEKETTGVFWEGICSMCQHENPYTCEKFTYMKLRLS